MKHRKLYDNIVVAVILVAIVAFLLAAFGNFMPDKVKDLIMLLSAPLALVAALFMEIIIPVIDNKAIIKEDKKRKNMLIIKCILFLLSVVPLVLYIVFDGQLISEIPSVIIFCIFYIGQFAIAIDPKPVKDLSDVEETVETSVDDTVTEETIETTESKSETEDSAEEETK